MFAVKHLKVVKLNKWAPVKPVVLKLLYITFVKLTFNNRQINKFASLMIA